MYGERRTGGFRPRGGGGGGGGMGAPTPPVAVGEELEVTIEAVGAKGDGIAKKNGFVLFIPGVKEGQKVRVRVTKVLRKVGFAEVCGRESSGGEEQSQDAPAEEAEQQEEQSEDTESFGDEQ